MYHLVSFADSRLHRSLKRLSWQADAFKIFEKIHLLNESDLSSNFNEHFKSKLISSPKGYGYWSWKPEVILNIINYIDNGDCLLYIDAGCHLNLNGKMRLIEYFEILKNADKGIVAFQADPPNVENSTLDHDGRKLFDQSNYRWIKGDLFDFFGFREIHDVVHAQAIGAGIILIKKCEAATAIIEEWKKIIWNRFDLLDDTPSVSPNFPGFIEHRHDQAIWTLLCIKHGVKTISAYEYWYPKNNSYKLVSDWNSLRNFPIHAKRDKDLGYFFNFFAKINMILKKIKTYHFKIKNKYSIKFLKK
ncbi:MAG: hypothetical protein EOM23_00720 [Candidatus Moranbacteria bacterium]|nr:hypothetical protein [Candidatus Moranbacteria bacterium]